jgi:hypothetical protein
MRLFRPGLMLVAALVTVAAVQAVAQAPAPGAPPAVAPDASTGADDAFDAPAAAQAGGRRAGALAACRADIQSLCAGTERGGGKIAQCLVQNRDKASPGCQAALQAAATNGKRGGQQAGAQAAMAACRTDVATFCGAAGERPGPCLKQNFAKLSQDCQSTLMALRAKRQQVAAACQAEGAELCPGKTGQEALQCLRQSEAKLGPACAAALKELPQRIGRMRAGPALQ